MECGKEKFESEFTSSQLNKFRTWKTSHSRRKYTRDGGIQLVTIDGPLGGRCKECVAKNRNFSVPVLPADSDEEIPPESEDTDAPRKPPQESQPEPVRHEETTSGVSEDQDVPDEHERFEQYIPPAIVPARRPPMSRARGVSKKKVNHRRKGNLSKEISQKKPKTGKKPKGTSAQRRSKPGPPPKADPMVLPNNQIVGSNPKPPVPPPPKPFQPGPDHYDGRAGPKHKGLSSVRDRPKKPKQKVPLGFYLSSKPDAVGSFGAHPGEVDEFAHLEPRRHPEPFYQPVELGNIPEDIPLEEIQNQRQLFEQIRDWRERGFPLSQSERQGEVSVTCASSIGYGVEFDPYEDEGKED